NFATGQAPMGAVQVAYRKFERDQRSQVRPSDRGKKSAQVFLLGCFPNETGADVNRYDRVALRHFGEQDRTVEPAAREDCERCTRRMSHRAYCKSPTGRVAKMDSSCSRANTSSPMSSN